MNAQEGWLLFKPALPRSGGAGSLRSSEMRSRTEGVLQQNSLVLVDFGLEAPSAGKHQLAATSPAGAVEDVSGEYKVSGCADA